MVCQLPAAVGTGAGKKDIPLPEFKAFRAKFIQNLGVKVEVENAVAFFADKMPVVVYRGVKPLFLGANVHCPDQAGLNQRV